MVRHRWIRDRAATGVYLARRAILASVLTACASSPELDEDPSPSPAVAAASPETATDSAQTADPPAAPVAPAVVETPIEGPAEASKVGVVTPSEAGGDDPGAVTAGVEAGTDEVPPPDAPTTGQDVDPEASSVGHSRVQLVPELLPLVRPRWIKHHRAPRESLGQIAYRYGVDQWKLREWNELAADDPPPRRRKRIRVHARRAPPPRERVEYTVQEGDSWWTIALRHGVDSRDLRAYNWPRKGKMQPGAKVDVWIDPVVHAWVVSGPDPVPLDRAGEQRRGAVGIGTPQGGILRNGLRVPEVEGIHLRMPRSAYGTSHAVEQLVLAITRFHEHSDYPLPVELGSMSLPRGGIIGHHKSHRTGRDVDIRLLRRPDVPAWKKSKGSRVQWSAVWQLVLAFSELDAMVIFLDYKAQRRLFRAAKASGASPEQLAAMMQYPRGSGASRGLVRHSPGHDTHLHVRFGCGAFETECVQ